MYSLYLCALLTIGQDPVDVEGQPLAANVVRLLEALDYLGAPLPTETVTTIKQACDQRDARRIQQLLDPYALLLVSINPESRVKVERGATRAVLQQSGFTPQVIKVINHRTVTQRLAIDSPQSCPVYAGV